jgi:hypothetical protein
MGQLSFTILFEYEIIPTSLCVRLIAEIEMTGSHTCIASNIRRESTLETPLLPRMELTKREDKWVHADSGKESNIGAAIGEAIDRHLMKLNNNTPLSTTL